MKDDFFFSSSKIYSEKYSPIYFYVYIIFILLPHKCCLNKTSEIVKQNIPLINKYRTNINTRS